MLSLNVISHAAFCSFKYPNDPKNALNVKKLKRWESRSCSRLCFSWNAFIDFWYSFDEWLQRAAAGLTPILQGLTRCSKANLVSSSGVETLFSAMKSIKQSETLIWPGWTCFDWLFRSFSQSETNSLYWLRVAYRNPPEWKRKDRKLSLNFSELYNKLIKKVYHVVLQEALEECEWFLILNAILYIFFLQNLTSLHFNRAETQQQYSQWQ